MRLIQLLLIGLACAATAGCKDQTADRSTPPQLVRAVRAATVHYQPSTGVTGEVKARIQSGLSFRTGGKVIERHADVGSRAKAGDILARIDDSEQQADVAIAQAGLDAAKATLQQKAQALARNEALLSSHTIAQSTQDQAQEDFTVAQGSLQTAEANLATAQDNLSYTVLRADADGVITARTAEVGQVVSAAQAVFTLAHDGPRDAVFDVFEAFFLAGQPAADTEVAPIADLARQVHGTIREISPVIDTTVGTVRVKVLLPQDAQWPLGTPVVGTFWSPANDEIILPSSVMASAGGTPAVWVVDPANHSASLRKVAVSLYRSRDVILAGGVSPQDLVVTEGGRFLTEGQTVTVEAK